MRFLSSSILVALGLTFLIPSLFGAVEKTNSISQQEILEISASGPQADSPFVIEQEEAQAALAQAATNPIYRNSLLKPRHSLQSEIKKLFYSATHLFAFHAALKGPAPLQLILEPSNFSVEETPEITVTFKITNNKKEALLLEFPTNQRLDILVKESNGHVLLRWSQDREFEPLPGLVTINEKESVLYTEKISTTGMHNGETYTLQAFLSGHPEYSLSQQVTPRGTH